MMHVHGEVEPPSHRTALPIPEQLEAIVLACLAKRPDDRPQTADELAERLASVPLEREWTGWRAREWWDRYQPEEDGMGRALEELVR
ncbi:MAG: hypothetical protein H0W29_05450 [Gemmatimonadales bacterium]|nr:hypothetical protein [Gemmatimonadales bacterium]